VRLSRREAAREKRVVKEKAPPEGWTAWGGPKTAGGMDVDACGRLLSRPDRVIESRSDSTLHRLAHSAAAILRDLPLTFPLLEGVRTAPKFIHANAFTVRVVVPLGIVPFNAELS
jgi:hypothetical protein